MQILFTVHLFKSSWYECVLDDDKGVTSLSDFSLVCHMIECRYSWPYILHSKHVKRELIEI